MFGFRYVSVHKGIIGNQIKSAGGMGFGFVDTHMVSFTFFGYKVKKRLSGNISAF